MQTLAGAAGGNIAPQPLVEDPNKRRSIQLDFLRGIAILLVLGHHTLLDYHDTGKLKPLFRGWFNLGWTGVDLFFVLSGFLIGGILFSEIRKSSRLNVKRFIIRRGFRIWPLYYLYLILATIAAMRKQHTSFPQAVRDLWFNYFHVQNYFHTPLFHTWSLAVEEHFYLVLPLALLIAIHYRKTGEDLKPILPIAGIVMVTCLLLRAMVPETAPSWLHQWPTQLRADSLFFGVLLAYMYHFRRAQLDRIIAYRYPLLACGLIGISIGIWVDADSEIMHTVGYSVLYAGYGAVLIAIIGTTPDAGIWGQFWKSLLARAIAFVGYFSYPIYLFHNSFARMPEGWFMRHGSLSAHAELRAIVTTLIYIVSAALIGAAFGKLIERPAIALRDRLFPSLA